MAAALGLVGYLWLTVAAEPRRGCWALVSRATMSVPTSGRVVSSLGVDRPSRAAWYRQVSASVAVQVDVILLSLLAPLAAVGTFGVALQLAVFGTAIPPILTAAIPPKFVGAAADRQQRLAQAAFEVLVSGGAALPLVAIVFARSSLTLIGGTGFAGGTTPLILLSFYAALSYPLAVFRDCLVYLRAEKAVLKIGLGTTIVVLVVAASTVPFFAANAAAVALDAGGVVALVWGATTFRRVAGFGVSTAKCARFVLVSGLLIAVYLVVHLAVGSPSQWLAPGPRNARAAQYLCDSFFWGITPSRRRAITWRVLTVDPG